MKKGVSEPFVLLFEHCFPGHQHLLVGATEAEIHQLEVYTNNVLPEFYKTFLRVMGKSTGPLRIPGVSLAIDRILAFYETADWQPPTAFVLLGIQDEDPHLDYYLDTLAPNDKGDCAVVRFPSEGEFSTEDYFFFLDPSLNDFICSWIFSEHLRAFSQRKTLMRNTRHPGDIDTLISRIQHQAVAEFGFTLLDTKTTAYCFFDRPDAALYVRKDQNTATVGVTIATRKGRLLQEITDRFCEAGDLVPLSI